MKSERELAADLAAAIRAAVAEKAPEAPRPDLPVNVGEKEAAARLALERARSHLAPTIPEGVPFARAKRIALRLLRFVWRDSAAFHSLSLDAAGELADAASSQRDSLERIHGQVARLEREWSTTRAKMERWTLAADKETSSRERRDAIENARLAALESAVAGKMPSPTPSSAVPLAIPPGVYSLFEERFRGTPEDIAAKQSGYVALLQRIPGLVLDIGCGRGEFLRLLAEKGIPASGVEINPIAIEECQKLGLSVEQEEGLSALARRPPASLGAVVALQVVEHWSPEMVFSFLREARRALAPGGVLIAESINVDSLSAWKAFFLDPSHVRPVPAETLRFLAEAAGFSDTRIEYHCPLPVQERLSESSENDAKLNRLLFGPQDYALVARVPGATKD